MKGQSIIMGSIDRTTTGGQDALSLEGGSVSRSSQKVDFDLSVLLTNRMHELPVPQLASNDDVSAYIPQSPAGEVMHNTPGVEQALDQIDYDKKHRELYELMATVQSQVEGVYFGPNESCCISLREMDENTIALVRSTVFELADDFLLTADETSAGFDHPVIVVSRQKVTN